MLIIHFDVQLPPTAGPPCLPLPLPVPYSFCCLLGYCICICSSVSAFVVGHLMPMPLPSLLPSPLPSLLPLLSPLLSSPFCLCLCLFIYSSVVSFLLFFFRFLLLFLLLLIIMSHNTLSLFWWNLVWVLRAASWRCCFIKTLLTCVWQHKNTEITMQRGSEGARGRG